MRRAGRNGRQGMRGLDQLDPDQTSSEFLRPATIADLANLSPFPRKFTGTGYKDIDYASRFKNAYTHPARRFAVHPERKLEISGAPLQTIADPERVQASFSRPFAPRGVAQVPIFAQQAQALLTVNVPVGYQYWIDGYAFDLFPSTANELNYLWLLRINGQDMLNLGTKVPQPGRPVHSPNKVTIGRDKTTMLLAQPGALVEIIVLALNTIGASDTVSGTVFGTLEGLQ